MASKLWPCKRQEFRYYKLEKPWLREQFGDCVSFVEVPGDVRVELAFRTSQGNEYTLRIYLKPNFPQSCPDLVVSSPNSPLNDKDGTELMSTLQNHCYDSSRYGLTMICHCRPELWNSQTMDLCDVFMKGLIWLEAYEAMLRTGEGIDTFLREMPASKDTLERIRKKIKKDARHDDFQSFLVHFDELMFQSGSDSLDEFFRLLLI